MLRKLWSTKEIYDIVNKAICDRQASGIPGNDTLQMLLDNGDEKLVVVGFIMGLLIAGARATGTTGAFCLFLDSARVCMWFLQGVLTNCFFFL